MYNTFFVINKVFSTQRMIYFAYYERLHFPLLRNKCALIWEGSGYPRNETPMDMSTLALVGHSMSNQQGI